MRQIAAFNQAEAGTLALDPLPFAPSGLLDEVISTYRARALHKGLLLKAHVAPTLPAFVQAPAPVIRQILSVLIGSARDHEFDSRLNEPEAKLAKPNGATHRPNGRAQSGMHP